MGFITDCLTCLIYSKATLPINAPDSHVGVGSSFPLHLMRPAPLHQLFVFATYGPSALLIFITAVERELEVI
jgi:hypothetical protein